MYAWSLDWEDPLEKDMATHSSILAWRISWIEEPGRLQSIGSHKVRHSWSDLAHTHTHTHTHAYNLSQDVTCGSVIHDLHYIEVCSLYAHFLESFCHKSFWIISKIFFCICWDGSYSFHSSICWYNESHWLVYGYWEILCIPGINPTWSWCMILLKYCWN